MGAQTKASFDKMYKEGNYHSTASKRTIKNVTAANIRKALSRTGSPPWVWKNGRDMIAMVVQLKGAPKGQYVAFAVGEPARRFGVTASDEVADMVERIKAVKKNKGKKVKRKSHVGQGGPGGFGGYGGRW